MKDIVIKIINLFKSIFSNNVNIKIENDNKYNIKKIKKSNITINDNGEFDETRKNN